MYRTPMLAALLCAGLILTACETTPPPAQMAQAKFENILEQAKSNPSPVSADKMLTSLLDGEVLDDLQRAELHYSRAFKRWHGGLNKPGAISDFEAFGQLNPLDSRARLVNANRAKIGTEILAHEGRLAGLQTLPAWFDDQVAMGHLKEAAARYRKSGLTPTDGQVHILREGGYVCVGGVSGAGEGNLHTYGNVPAYAADLVWC